MSHNLLLIDNFDPLQIGVAQLSSASRRSKAVVHTYYTAKNCHTEVEGVKISSSLVRPFRALANKVVHCLLFHETVSGTVVDLNLLMW